MSNYQCDSADVGDQPGSSDAGEPGEIITENTLLSKSREKYQAIYKKFTSWRETNNKGPLSQEVLLDFFVELSEKMKPSSLWSHYSMLKHTINSNDKIDISSYKKLNVFLKLQSTGFKSKQTKVLTPNDIERFLNEAPDNQFLATKVALIFGIIGACRRQELCNITMDDIEDDGVMAFVTIPKTESDPERSFTICGEFYNMYKKYFNLRPRHVGTKRFFVNYQNGKCTHQVIGINKFGSMPRTIASYLKLPNPESYTGHSFRRTSATLLADSGADLATLKRHGGWKSKVARHFIEYSKEKKRKLCQQITESVILRPSTSASTSKEEPPALQAPSEQTVPTNTDDPLFIDCSSNIKEENTSMETADDEATEEVPDPEPESESNESASAVMQSNSQSNSSPKPLKAPSQPVRSQLRNIAPAPSSQQKNSSKTLVVKRIPLKVKPVAPTTIKMLPRQPPARVPQNVVPQQPAEVCLRWNSYHSNMQTSFPSLLDSEEFVDVTLACEGKSVKCHKIILSSCSDYLATLLRENPCQHPIILMKDLKFWEVEALVKFMYKGEVNVAHDKLPQLLNAAEALQVKGLAGPTPPQGQKPPMLIPKSRLQSTTPTPSKPLEPKEQKAPSNSSSKAQSSPKRCTKRPMESKDSRPFTKIRLHHPKPSAPSPTIKLEPLDIPLSDTDIFSEVNDDSSTTNYENLITMHEADDPGGEERPDSADGDIQFDFHGSDDITDAEEQMEFVPTDFLEQEHDILEEVDGGSSRNSVVEVGDGNPDLNRAETPDDEVKDDEGDGDGDGDEEGDGDGEGDEDSSKKDET
ncbi:uncharacterized protein LOC135160192 [Diachasmimorpha longicaudata]|uniref:uncharacterized protein LOC135160192 n=1 Tax=Diachasmimorpha longicaudata TaxID=58733 RepID=UPI0030B912F1